MNETEQQPNTAVGSTGLVGINLYLPYLKAWGVYLTRLLTWYGLAGLAMLCSTILTAQGEWWAMLCCWVSGVCLLIVGASVDEPEMPTTNVSHGTNQQ